MPRLSVAAALSVLTGAMQTGAERRQAFDPPERLIEVAERQASIDCRRACGFETKAAFRSGRRRAGAVRRAHPGGGGLSQRPEVIPEDRVAQTMNDLFGAPLLRPASLTGLW